MLKKSALFGLVLLIVGTVALQYVLDKIRKEQQQLASCKLNYSKETDEYLRQYNQWLQSTHDEQALIPWELNKSFQTKTEAELKLQQQERLKADLDKLAAGETQIYPFADVLYGENWQNELRKYKSQKELSETIFTSSIVCTSTGAAIFSWCILLWTARQIIKVSYRLKRLQIFLSVLDKPFTQTFANFLRKQRQHVGKKLFQTIAKNVKENPEQVQESHGPKSLIEKHTAALINSGWQSPALVRRNSKSGENPIAAKSAKNAEKIAVLLADEKYTESKQPLTTTAENKTINTTQLDLFGDAKTNASSNSREKTSKLEHSLKAQTENLEKQMAEFKQMAKTVQQTTVEHSKPLNNAIKELTQQVSAIRQYAACQQDRMEKLQDGYDWNIIRTFCLRVIRCIDNLENRINQLAKKNIETTDLEEVKDELLFALDSSGVEQFEPEINSDYRGQEKFAEAIKDKQQCDNPKQTGKIAKVIRPGYQYFINEDNVKIVRTAQVKLYG